MSKDIKLIKKITITRATVFAGVPVQTGDVVNVDDQTFSQARHLLITGKAVEGEVKMKPAGPLKNKAEQNLDHKGAAEKAAADQAAADAAAKAAADQAAADAAAKAAADQAAADAAAKAAQ